MWYKLLIQQLLRLVGHRFGFQALVKYQLATFVFHCYTHRLNFILSKSIVCKTECRWFVITSSEIFSFFLTFYHPCNCFKNFMDEKIPEVAPTRWLVNSVNDYRECLTTFFSSIEYEPGVWTADEMNTASGFVCFLYQFYTRSLLITFTKYLHYLKFYLI